jgi:hypothetical protein
MPDNVAKNLERRIGGPIEWEKMERGLDILNREEYAGSFDYNARCVTAYKCNRFNARELRKSRSSNPAIIGTALTCQPSIAPGIA